MDHHRPDRPRLFIVAGLPGSGKTTMALALASRFDATRMCPDEWMIAAGIDLWDTSARARIEECQFDMTSDLLRNGGNVIIEWGTWTRRERDALREAARCIPAAVELRLLDVAIETLWQRVSDRNRDAAFGQRPITYDELAMWNESFERPTREELALYDPPVGA